MLYSILIYDSEAVVEARPAAENAAHLEQHIALQKTLRSAGRLGPVARLMPTTAAVTVTQNRTAKKAGKPVILDGPFAETKEHLVGFYIFECDSLDEAIAAAQTLPLDSGALEVRPIGWFEPGVLPTATSD